jgi:hypothetical protein
VLRLTVKFEANFLSSLHILPSTLHFLLQVKSVLAAADQAPPSASTLASTSAAPGNAKPHVVSTLPLPPSAALESFLGMQLLLFFVGSSQLYIVVLFFSIAIIVNIDR